MSKYCVYSGRDCEILPSTEKEIWDNAYQQGKTDGIKEFLNQVKADYEFKVDNVNYTEHIIEHLQFIAEQLTEEK